MRGGPSPLRIKMEGCLGCTAHSYLIYVYGTLEYLVIFCLPVREGDGVVPRFNYIGTKASPSKEVHVIAPLT